MSSLRVMAACLVAFGVVAVAGEGQAPDDAKQLIIHLAREFDRSFLLQEATPPQRLEELVADDAVFVWSNGQRCNGKAECLQACAKGRDEIRRLFKDIAVAYDAQAVRLLGDAAIVLGKITMSGTLNEGDRPVRREVWQTLIFAMTPAGWRLVQEHSTVIPPKPENP
ncbi:MAG TPA: nuclear transport factor 2 family protein [Planctomycetota bacterium]|nr:nuclear transport factor 2 family protein [Planctomycetota bacterium]